MQTLSNENFEQVMHDLYFYPFLWVEGPDNKKHSTPLSTDVCEWLSSPYNEKSDFWVSING